jgi:hypothetical protein
VRFRITLLFVIVLICSVSIWYGISGECDIELPDWKFASQEKPVTDESEIMNKQIHIAILNGTSVSALASDVSLAIEYIGCVVDAIENAPHSNYKESILINRRLDSDLASELASMLGGIPVICEYDGRTVEDVVLVLGADYQKVTDSIDIISGKTGL